MTTVNQNTKNVMTKMCLRCLDSYGMPHQGIQLIGESCHCCTRRYVTVYCLSGEQIDNFNEQEKKNHE
jgi:hypothetical protein